MNALAKECDEASVDNPFNWDVMLKIVCRHLDIAVSSPRDTKHILKDKREKEVAKVLLECAKTNKKNVNVLGGVLMVVRKLLEDVLVANEIFAKDLDWYSFVLGCLKLHPQHPPFRVLTISTILQFVRYTPSHPHMHEHAIEGLAKVTRLIPFYFDELEVLMSLLMILRLFLFCLNTYRGLNGKPIPTSAMDSLQLPELARTLVELLDRSTSPVFTGDLLDAVSEIMTWIAYYKRNAILRLPSHTGVLLFVAFLSCQSPLVRCRGLTGLLNLRREYGESARSLHPEVLCQMQQTTVAEDLSLSQFLPIIGPTYIELDPNTPYETFIERHTYPFSDECSDGIFDAYEAALRFVDYELNGPKSTDEWHVYPFMRIFGIEEPTAFIIEDMMTALMVEGKEYEARVVRTGYIMRWPTDSTEMTEHISVGTSVSSNPLVTILSADGRKKWPEKAYFYYTGIRALAGSRYTVLANRGLQCADCTPYLKQQIEYEMNINLFSLATAYLSFSTCESSEKAWGVLHFRRLGKAHLMEAATVVRRLSKQYASDVPEGQFIKVLLSATAMTYFSLPSHIIDFLIDKATMPASPSLSGSFKEYSELRRVMLLLKQHRPEASRRWSSLTTLPCPYEDEPVPVIHPLTADDGSTPQVRRCSRFPDATHQ
ncbi:hypothetical protein SISSUDRAFT_1042329 [Sistotremastrum suecicum HHB10207 ss-3]|uniref:ARM repeat-containing protein n=1 Tax=Sistotremastrum suecicum HHB10207 ss-3 TaxID=1314776 RepID=A0A166GM54_9AGAM|nr:hypothetical protein SISSUDRAFT_1042329 [Sistotremastrum suecicum HHB10207 ss-3]